MGQRFDQEQSAGVPIYPGDEIALEKGFLEGLPVSGRQHLDGSETHIVAGGAVPVSRIPQSDNGEIQGLLLDLLLCGLFFCFLRFGLFRLELRGHLFDLHPFVGHRTDDLVR